MRWRNIISKNLNSTNPEKGYNIAPGGGVGALAESTKNKMKENWEKKSVIEKLVIAKILYFYIKVGKIFLSRQNFLTRLSFINYFHSARSSQPHILLTSSCIFCASSSVTSPLFIAFSIVFFTVFGVL